MWIISSIVFIIFSLAVPSTLFAEIKEIISEGTYNMGDGETPSVAESRALLNAKKMALEQAGTYVESYSKVKNFKLSQDEIHVLASGLMEVEILEKKRTIVGEGINFWVKIKAKIISDKMEEMAKRVKEKSIIDDYKRIQEAYAKSQKEIEALKKQLTRSGNEKDKKILEAKIIDDERLFQANEWYEKARNYSLKNQREDAIVAFTSAIDLNQNFALALAGRGAIYSDEGQNDKALEDFDKAIALKPDTDILFLLHVLRGNIHNVNEQYDRAIEDFNLAIKINYNLPMVLSLAYAGRGMAYAKKGQYDSAIADCNKAITITPKDKSIYAIRGFAYFGKKQNLKAINDYNKAIAADPNKASNYMLRAAAFYNEEQYINAINDYNKCIDLKPIEEKAYFFRGKAYHASGKYDKSILDYDKFISMEPNNAIAYSVYYWRGTAYFAKGQYEKAIADYDKSIVLKPNDEESYYMRGKSYFNKRGTPYDILQAIDDLSKAIMINPDYADAYFFRGHIYGFMDYYARDKGGNEDAYHRAVEDFYKACQKGNKNSCNDLQKILKK